MAPKSPNTLLNSECECLGSYDAVRIDFIGCRFVGINYLHCRPEMVSILDAVPDSLFQ